MNWWQILLWDCWVQPAKSGVRKNSKCKHTIIQTKANNSMDMLSPLKVRACVKALLWLLVSTKPKYVGLGTSVWDISPCSVGIGSLTLWTDTYSRRPLAKKGPEFLSIYLGLGQMMARTMPLPQYSTIFTMYCPISLESCGNGLVFMQRINTHVVLINIF